MSIQGLQRMQNIRFVFVISAGLLIWKALDLQVLNTKFRDKAKVATRDLYTLYPVRGVMYDREGRLLVTNNTVYDIMAVYNQIDWAMDTTAFCELLGITPEYFVENVNQNWLDNRFSKRKPFVFLSKVSKETYARFQENMYRFPGFIVQKRNVRGYPHKNAAHVLGYIREVNKKEVEIDTLDYSPGDYIGASGLEKTYERELKGTKGYRYVLKDALGRPVDFLQDTTSQEAPISGRDLYTTLDLNLQAYGEHLMQNKVGSIVAIEPATGEILAMVSTPTYDPNLLTINQSRSKSYAALNQDSLKPFLDRSIMGYYPPGSPFKTLVALIALQEGRLNPNRTIFCQGGYFLNGQNLMKCHNHPTCTSVQMAIQHSCNAYFATVFRDVVDQFGPDQVAVGLDTFNAYLHRFGLGDKLAVDLPGEVGGNYPTPAYFDNVYKKESSWKSVWIRSLGIGQGELLLTNLQMANLAAIIANRGFYIQPHLVRGLQTNVDAGQSTNVRLLQYPEHETGVEGRHFETIVNGMEMVVRAGTARSAAIEDIIVCGKTGTAENAQRGGQDHSIFFAFAPKENPEIAIAVYVENGGWGGSYAAPIASLMIEKYLHKDGEIKGTYRKYLEKRIIETNLIDLP
ncbi:MAG: penicillin-binding protein 2 [Saprospiraceae bacterium]|nr:penicillin-binding protein 2 [Lewinella sp.]